jgi:hypothetical protein
MQHTHLMSCNQLQWFLGGGVMCFASAQRCVDGLRL